MKKFFRGLGITVGALILIILTYVYMSFNFYNPKDPAVEPQMQAPEYFQNSYEESRKAFYEGTDNLKQKVDSLSTFSRTVPSKIDQDLTIDFCYVPATGTPKKLFILSSGVHGVEGFVGSAVQQMFMREVLSPGMLEETGVLLIHGINPYGFKYVRRVTENNVDFNRNCDVDDALFLSQNEGYNELYEMLNPVGIVKTGSIKNKFFMLVAINKLLQESMASLRQAVLQGQYQHKKGLYYGGAQFEPQLHIIGDVLKSISEDYSQVFNIDIHTGFGERGVSHLFPNPVEDNKVKSTLEDIFEGYTIDWGDSDDFYTISGSFSDYIGKLLPNKFYLPMMLEFGTLNSQTTIGSVKSIHNMVLENQGTHYGYKSEKDSLKIKRSFLEMYNPSSEKWRTKIIADSKVILSKALSNFTSL